MNALNIIKAGECGVDAREALWHERRLLTQRLRSVWSQTSGMYSIATQPTKAQHHKQMPCDQRLGQKSTPLANLSALPSGSSSVSPEETAERHTSPRQKAKHWGSRALHNRFLDRPSTIWNKTSFHRLDFSISIQSRLLVKCLSFYSFVFIPLDSHLIHWFCNLAADFGSDLFIQHVPHDRIGIGSSQHLGLYCHILQITPEQ